MKDLYIRTDCSHIFKMFDGLYTCIIYLELHSNSYKALTKYIFYHNDISPQTHYGNADNTALSNGCFVKRPASLSLLLFKHVVNCTRISDLVEYTRI